MYADCLKFGSSKINCGNLFRKNFEASITPENHVGKFIFLTFSSEKLKSHLLYTSSLVFAR